MTRTVEGAAAKSSKEQEEITSVLGTKLVSFEKLWTYLALPRALGVVSEIYPKYKFNNTITPWIAKTCSQTPSIIISVAQIKSKPLKPLNLRLYSTGKPKEKVRNHSFMLKPSGEKLHRRSSLALTRSRSFISRRKVLRFFILFFLILM